MADKKISQLTAATTPLTGTEELPIVQSGETRRVTSDNLTVKSLRSNTTTGVLQVTGPTAATTRTMTTPDANFTVARTDASQTFTGAQTFNANVVVANESDVVFQADATVEEKSIIQWLIEDGSEMSSIRCGRATAFGEGYMDFYVRGAGPSIKRGGFDLSGNFTLATGNLVIGTSGKGIDFSADGQAAGMTSELLDDYEEGTWTPVIGGETSESGQAYTAQRGMYTKVGRMVTCTFDVVLATKGTITGDVALKGLPFTALNNADARYPACNIGLWQNLASGYVYINGVVIDNSTYAGLRGITAAATALAGFGTAAITDTTRFSGTVTYFTA